MKNFSEVPVKPDVPDTSDLSEAATTDRPRESEDWQGNIELPEGSDGWVDSIELTDDSEGWQDSIDLEFRFSKYPIESMALPAENDDQGDRPNESQTLTEEEKNQIKAETGWSEEIIDNIQNMKQYEILKNANLVEVEINGRKCLVRTDIDLDKEWNTGKFDANGNPIYETNRERMEDGKPPLDKNGKPIELHHLGQKADSPLVELTVEEHRTGEYEDGKKNQSLWHDNAKETEVHGEGKSWDQEREAHWETRAEQTKGR